VKILEFIEKRFVSIKSIQSNERKWGVEVEQVPGVEIVFHEKIGAHDVTAVRTTSVSEFVSWSGQFLARQGIVHSVVSSDFETLAGDYISDGFNYFVFDVVNVSKNNQSVEPLLYRFESNSLYYPLRISSLTPGTSNITLLVLMPLPIESVYTPFVMDYSGFDGKIIHPGPLFVYTSSPLKVKYLVDKRRYLTGGWSLPMHLSLLMLPVRFMLTGDELRSVTVTRDELKKLSPDIGGIHGDNDVWLTVLEYHGQLSNLTSDLLIENKQVQDVLNQRQLKKELALEHCMNATAYYRSGDYEKALSETLTGLRLFDELDVFNQFSTLMLSKSPPKSQEEKLCRSLYNKINDVLHTTSLYPPSTSSMPLTSLPSTLLAPPLPQAATTTSSVRSMLPVVAISILLLFMLALMFYLQKL
jgi:hypothetical protein